MSAAGASSGTVVVPEPPQARVRARLAKVMFGRVARRVGVTIEAAEHDGAAASPSSGCRPSVRILRPESFYRRLSVGGMVGVGEAYQAGDWDSEDVPGLLTAFAANIDELVPPWLQSVWVHSLAPRRPRAEEQTMDGARRNARRHYALPNELFRAFLDETMCYSCAIFPTDGQGAVIADEGSLADAQRAKIDRLLDMAGVGNGVRLLEIGTGWGELPVRAARRGAYVHTITNMAEHAALASDRIAKAKLADRVHVQLGDYRELTAEAGRYDAIVSVEMIEAVGRRYWPTYFRAIDRLLAPGGCVGLQAMTMRHDRMLRASDSYTWIDKHIFPGELLPSIRAIEETLAYHTGLRVLSRDSFGPHYAATLALWRKAFNQNWPSMAALGFDDVFRRTWDFYLASCQAGFAVGYLDVHQFLIGA